MIVRTRIILAMLCVAAGAACALILLVPWLGRDTTLELQVRDSVSGRWVWDVSMVIQNRIIVGFYQTDTGLRPYRFTHLAPGPTTLDVSAPGYLPVSLALVLRRGENRIGTPISMVAPGIPGLARFFVFEAWDEGNLVAELRPVSTGGTAITNHPCIDLWVGCRVSVQMNGGAPAEEPASTGSSRGRTLYEGELRWTWDPAPERQFRYRVPIPAPVVQSDSSPYRVIDYLIVEGDPSRISRTQLGDLMARLYQLGDPARITAALDAEKDRLRYFVDTSWNVPARSP